MKRFLLAMMALGLGLLGLILYQTNLGEVWNRLTQVGWWGFALILLIYLVCLTAQAGSWLFTLEGVKAGLLWLYRLTKAAMVGFAMEATTPLAGLGGEPIKAILLKRHYGIRYRDATASLVLTRTTDLAAQTIFISLGFLLMFRSDTIPQPYRIAAASGLVVLVGFLVGFLVVQQQRALTRIRSWLERGWLGGRSLSDRAARVLDSLPDIDDRLVRYYRAEPGRLALSVLAAFADWTIGTVAVWLALKLLGHPVSFGDALVIEAFVVLVRSTLFFVPADLGTQEGALVLICSAVAGSGEAGLAVSALRRARDILWIAWGLGLGSLYSLRDPGEPEAEAAEALSEPAPLEGRRL